MCQYYRVNICNCCTHCPVPISQRLIVLSPLFAESAQVLSGPNTIEATESPFSSNLLTSFSFF